MADAPVRHPAKQRMLQRREESSSPEPAISQAISASEVELGTPVERSTDDASSSSHSSYREEGLDPDQGDMGDMYDVEAVMGWRLSEAGTPEYLIKWFGFDPADNTWEPAEHLTT